MARLISDARVIAPAASRQSFFNSLSIFPISTGCPNEKVSATAGIKSEPPPRAAVAREKFICFIRAPRTSGIENQLRSALLLRPRIFDWVDERPRFFDFIAARKQRRVAAHRVEEQTFIRFRASLAKRRSVMKIHFHRLDPEACARHFRLHSQRNSFV